MGTDYLIYPLLFVGLYFQVFVLLVFLSAPARARRERGRSDWLPTVAMIVPCWNEEETIKSNVESLLALDYPEEKLFLVVVNDGSSDRSGEIIDAAFANHPRVRIFHQENGGKHSALNTGIAHAEGAELVGCLDADSFVERDALREIVGCFEDPKVAAATVSMSVHNPRSLLELIQNVEYLLGIALRHVFSAVNGIYVTPGPFSLYRRDVVLEIGGFRYGHQTEDMEMALRLQRAGYWIENAPKARVYTKVPTTVRGLVKQRTRWTTGFLRNVALDYRDLVGNPRFGVLGTMVLPLGFFAIFAGLLTFGLLIYTSIANAIRAYQVYSAVPISVLLSQRFSVSFDWFYLPVTLLTALGVVSFAGIVLFIVIGKRVSGTPGRVWWGIVLYTLLYQLLAPLWLIRSVKDFFVGTTRPWR